MVREMRRLLDLELELENEQAPPLGGLVVASVRQGRRMRRTRRAWLGATVAAGVAASMVLGTAIAGELSGPPLVAGAPSALPSASPQAGSASPPGGSALTSSAPSSQHAPPVPTVRNQSDARLMPATPEGLIELLIRLLPAGETSSYAKVGGDLHVQVYLDRGKGPGMIRLSVLKTTMPQVELCRPDVTCRDLPGGRRAMVSEIKNNCVQRYVVTVARPDGVAVKMDLASCLEWDGTANQPSPVALTTDEAVAIATDERWGMLLPFDIVAAGKSRLPTVRDIRGG